MATGLGKCFAAGTPILMHDGSIKPIEEVAAGERVMGVDSTPRLVRGIARGVEEMFRVTPTKGDPYVVNGSHILSLKITWMGRKRVTDSLGRKYSTGDICNISVRDYLLCSSTFRHVAKGWRVGVDFHNQPLSIPPYVLGLWIGDGTSRTTEITTMESEVIEFLEAYCEQNSMKLNPCNSQTSGKALTYSITGKTKEWGCNELRSKLKGYGLINNKHIPEQYIANSKENRLELLAGLLDTDGYLVDGNVFEFSTAKKEINDSVLFLARSLCFAAYSKEKIVKGATYYRINISGDTHLIPTKVKRRIASQRRQKKDVLVTGITVESVGVGDYFGFEIDGEDKLFLLGDFTVVHNTVTFSQIPRQGRMLILSHREELVWQPKKYFDCSYGVEQAGHKSNGEEVVSASVQSLVRRLKNFRSDDFDVIITDECHHSTSPTYMKIYDHFKPRLHLGFTATPNRHDGVGLEHVYEDIVFERDLEWGIKNGFLSPIRCLRADIDYDLRGAAVRMGDYAPSELEAAMNIEAANKAIADTYQKYAAGQTLIFACSVAHAKAIAKEIPGAVAVVGGEEREETLERFKKKEIQVLVNCMVFTEGTDLPNIETVIIARPTKNISLYTQCVGRGTRLFPGKEQLTLIDCVGSCDEVDICTAPSLIGMDIQQVKQKKQIEGDLFDLPELIKKEVDNPGCWVKNVEYVDLWARSRKYKTHGVNYYRMPDGAMILSKPKFVIPPEDALGRTMWNGKKVPTQRVFDEVFRALRDHHDDTRHLWDLSSIKRWGAYQASDKQKELISRWGIPTEGLTKLDAMQILTRVMCRVGGA